MMKLAIKAEYILRNLEIPVRINKHFLPYNTDLYGKTF